MSLSSCFIEFSITKLTFCSIIILCSSRHLRNSTTDITTFTCSRIIHSSCSHSSSKHFTLCFPFSSFTILSTNRFFFLLFLHLSLWCLFRRHIIVRTKPIILLIFYSPLLFHIKCLPLLNKYFLTYLLMLRQGLSIEFSTTRLAFYSFIRSIIIIIFILILSNFMSITNCVLIKILRLFFLFIIFLRLIFITTLLLNTIGRLVLSLLLTILLTS